MFLVTTILIIHSPRSRTLFSWALLVLSVFNLVHLVSLEVMELQLYVIL